MRRYLLVLAASCAVLADLWIVAYRTGVSPWAESNYALSWLLILLSGVLAIPYAYASLPGTAVALAVAILHALACINRAGLDDRTFFGGGMLPVVAAYVWLIVSLLLLVTGLLGRLTRPARRPHAVQPVCTECGYDLRGLPALRCPECGTPFVADANESLSNMSSHQDARRLNRRDTPTTGREH